MDREHQLSADVPEESKKINLVKSRYAKNPTKKVNAQILDWYGKAVNPSDKLTNLFKEL